MLLQTDWNVRRRQQTAVQIRSATLNPLPFDAQQYHSSSTSALKTRKTRNLPLDRRTVAQLPIACFWGHGRMSCMDPQSVLGASDWSHTTTGASYGLLRFYPPSWDNLAMLFPGRYLPWRGVPSSSANVTVALSTPLLRIRTPVTASVAI
jgi:hypothetical protein